MKNRTIWMTVLAAFVGIPAMAQNIVGSWQGSLPVPVPGRPPLRIVMKISRAPADEKLNAVMYSIDQGGQPLNASAISQQGANVKITIAAIGAEYAAKVSADGNAMTGTYTQGPQPTPFNLVRETPQTAWAIPDPPPPPRLMAASAKPTFDVATIKPSRPEAQGKSILVGRGGTNLFTTTNTTLNDLITFAYSLHARQLTGGPGWLDNERYDITAKPDTDGVPNVEQLKSMVQKLLVDRFQLTFHREKKELSVYAITVAKGGVKMARSDANAGSLPGFGGRGPGNVGVRNSTMEEFAGFLQNRILDRPVVNQTELADHFDFTLKWTPDSNGPIAPGQPAPPPPDADAPDLFGAVQQQLGLKLESTKAPVEVMVIDKVEKPSEN